MPYFKLIGKRSGDRLGANYLSYICQIIFAHFMQYYIVYDTFNFSESIFIQSLQDYIEYYNKGKTKDDIEITTELFTKNKECDTDEPLFFSGFVVSMIQMDIYTYFHLYIEKDFVFRIHHLAQSENKLPFDPMPFDPKKTILVHLRLDDLHERNSFDYDGNIVSKYFIEKMNNNYFYDYKEYKKTTFFGQYYRYISKSGLTKELLTSNKKLPNDYYKILLYQSIMKEEKIQKRIDELSEKYPEDEIIIISSQKGNIQMKYKTIRSQNPDYDLYCLCQCKKVILSRSTYALSSLLFSNKTEVSIPSWSITACMGLQTKYDKTKYDYFG